jgi:hypothetical protein
MEALMKQLVSSSIFLIFTVLFSLNSYAGLLIEPVVGYNLGAKADFENGEKYSGGVGPSFGGRLGYQNFGLQLGLDYLNSTIDLDDPDLDDDLSTSEWAAFVGFKFPILLRVYGGYIFSATGETKSGGTKVELEKGNGYKAGIGFTGLPFLEINVEYRSGTFEEWTSGTIQNDTSVDYQSIMVGLSLPLVF